MATQRPTISYPVITSNDAPTDRRAPITPVSPPKTPSPPRGHRHLPSISKPMTWLTRTSSSDNNHQHKRNASTPIMHSSSPIHISEPKFAHTSLLMLNPVRCGVLGTGATVVRTPQEALAGSGVQLGEDEMLEGIEEEGGQEQGAIVSDDDNSRELPSPPDSPPLPPVPTRTSGRTSVSKSPPDLRQKENTVLPLPASKTPSPTTPSKSTFDSSSSKELPPLDMAYSQSTSPYPLQPSDNGSTISVPSLTTMSPIQPPFDAILLSPVPSSTIDQSKIIISLETSTTTYRTTLATLTSRPSHLSKFLTSIVPGCGPEPEDRSDTASVSSQPRDTTDNSFNSIFHNHLTAAGLISQSSTNLHIFLDRPSAPYAHILNYLRSPTTSPSTLPYALQLLSSSTFRLETLLELRDEAKYLDLENLSKLCVDEIRIQEHFLLHSHIRRSSSNDSFPNLHSLRDIPEIGVGTDRRSQSTDQTRSSGSDESSGVLSSRQRGSSSSRRDAFGLGMTRSNTKPPVGWI